MKTSEKFQAELNNCGRIPMFEIPATDIATGEQEYICCDIAINRNYVYCQRDSVSLKEDKSNKIASSRIRIDPCFSLDDHLQSLYDEVIEAICNGDKYELSE